MVKKSEKQTKIEEPSLLAQFNLHFEHDKTWVEAKRDVRNRRER